MRRRNPGEDGRDPATNRDRGASLIEILVSVVLLGLVVVAVLGALRTSVIGTRVERDHAKAYQWLQSAQGVLHATERIGCEYDPAVHGQYVDGEEKMRLRYQDLVRDDVVNPPGWADHQLTVLPPVRVWDGSHYWDPNEAPKPCFEEDGYFLQLITLQVTNPNGDIIETLQVVKRD